MELSTPIQFIKGVGPHVAKHLERIGITTVRDLLWHLPFRYVDRRTITPIAQVTPGKERVIIGQVITSGVAFLGRRRTRIFEVLLGDGTGTVSAKWFHFYPRAMQTRFPKGQQVLCAGELTQFGGIKQFIHPEVELLEDEGDAECAGKLLPIYPLTEGLTQRQLRRMIREAWTKARPRLTDTLPTSVRTAFQFDRVPDALEALHFPTPEANLALLNDRRTSATRTLIFEECFILELGLGLRRAHMQTEVGIPMPPQGTLLSAFRRVLPFSFTRAQERVRDEIDTDMQRPCPMHRLIQGDVGSGKTVVAIAAALHAIAAGYQVAFMAPTEILAEQHAQTVRQWLTPLKIPWALLTASIKGPPRRQIYAQTAAGDLPLLIGTHALVEEAVQFARLGLVIVDEQHRFGVAQRAALKKKGLSPHLLVMSATPIPRTLAMTVYGDLDVSIIDELPAGRTAIVTKIYEDRQRGKLYDGMRKELAKGRQVYVVYPLVAESEGIDLKNATDMAKVLTETFGPTYRVALLHGQMCSDEKEAIMRDFTAGRIHILATTSVVEVGVDVPNATVMVIEHAERFGLSQLHQLRGRVGRGPHQSYCILVANLYQSPTARARLHIMTETTDGFRIAEEDLQIRGPGEFLGTRQSGLPELKVANLLTDQLLITAARQTAFQLTATDPTLSHAEHAPLRAAVMERWGTRLELGKVG